jgi:hypothetical protein
MPFTLENVALALLPSVRMGRALAHREWLTLVSAAEVLMSGAPHGVSPEQISDNVERFLIAGRSRRAWRVRILLHLIEFLPLATDGARFSALSLARRRALVERRWIAGKHVWRICGKVRDLVLLGAYGDGRAVATGYVPVPLRSRFRHLRRPETADEVA